MLVVNKNVLLRFFFISALFFPTRYFYLYFIYIGLFSVFIILTSGKPVVKKQYLLIAGLFFCYLLIGAFFRFFYYDFDGLRDFVEITRFVPIALMVLFKSSFAKMKFTGFLNTIKFYVVFDAIVSFMQFNKINSSVISLIENLYSYESHIETSLFLSDRALGLSSNPGEHGIFMLVMFTVIFLNFLDDKKKISKYDLIFLVLSSFSILTSQSQTAFLGLAVINILVLIYYSFTSKNKTNFGIYFLSAACGVGYLIFNLLERLRYLYTLFSLGLGRSSYQKREEKVSYLLDKAFGESLNVFLGWGKEFFGADSSAMDNEYVYIFLVYGPVIGIVFIVFLLRIIMNNFQTTNLYAKIFLFLVAIGIPLAWPNSYFTSPKVVLFLTFFYVNFYIVKNENTPSSRL